MSQKYKKKQLFDVYDGKNAKMTKILPIFATN